jgi:hypothetical protein
MGNLMCCFKSKNRPQKIGKLYTDLRVSFFGIAKKLLDDKANAAWTRSVCQLLASHLRKRVA